MVKCVCFTLTIPSCGQCLRVAMIQGIYVPVCSMLFSVFSRRVGLDGGGLDYVDDCGHQ